ncbi:E3 ubiquitin-protein ligase RNF146-like [Anopheles maculipalpis]|uniref:E3 ubiquitin-protein ligase RNF146-like n=1 Tax=Anopheles maculipalpis TaxID=1496333 RepID=UPI0021593B6E|nr:E3 ubiquitin-protein ligase RNF146-like [Anopheles maculipalpis]
MVKEKPNSIRIYDKDGYRRRAACICVRSEAEAEVLLVTSSRRPELWIVPGGGVEPEEEASLTATREVLEEAGVMGQLGRCLGVFENTEHMHRTEVFVMVVTQELDEWEDSKTIGRKRQWFSIEEALSQLALHKPTQRHYLQQLRHSKHRTSSASDPPPIISEHDNDDFTSEPDSNNCTASQDDAVVGEKDNTTESTPTTPPPPASCCNAVTDDDGEPVVNAVDSVSSPPTPSSMAESIESNTSTPTSARSEDGDREEIPKKPEATSSDTKFYTTESKLECPVCLQTCVHPVRLPCGHIFCFLCVKGVAFKNLRCAMCRCEIPLTYLDHPQLVNGVEEIVRAATATVSDGNEYRWYYEGGHGWWQYDERTSQELEEAYLRGDKSCKILVAGFVYIVSFEHKCQIRQNDYSRIRRIKRDLVSIPKKGVAGLRLETVGDTNSSSSATNDMNELSSAMGEMNLNEGASTSSASTYTAGTVNVREESESIVTNEPAHEVEEEGGDDGVESENNSNAPGDGADSTTGSSTTRSSSHDHVSHLMVVDLTHQLQYSATDSDEEESDADDNLLVL